MLYWYISTRTNDDVQYYCWLAHTHHKQIPSWSTEIVHSHLWYGIYVYHMPIHSCFGACGQRAWPQGGTPQAYAKPSIHPCVPATYYTYIVHVTWSPHIFVPNRLHSLSVHCGDSFEHSYKTHRIHAHTTHTTHNCRQNFRPLNPNSNPAIVCVRCVY